MIDGYDKRSMMDRFRKCYVRRIVDGGPRCVALRCVIKRMPFRPLDLDLAVEMHRYNAAFNARVDDVIR